MSSPSSPLKNYATTARCCAIDKAVNGAYAAIDGYNHDLMTWLPSDGIDELARKVEGIKAEADLLLSRVRPLVEG